MWQSGCGRLRGDKRTETLAQLLLINTSLHLNRAVSTQWSSSRCSWSMLRCCRESCCTQASHELADLSSWWASRQPCSTPSRIQTPVRVFSNTSSCCNFLLFWGGAYLLTYLLISNLLSPFADLERWTKLREILQK